MFLKEFKYANLDYYFNTGELNDLEWRKFPPGQVFEIFRKLSQKINITIC